jgi:Tfp pilus assembly protein PilX
VDPIRLGARLSGSQEPFAVNRRGFVLAAALLVVVLIAAMVAGVFFATMEETHIADTASSRELALTAAESAIQSTIDAWADRSGQGVGAAGEELSTFGSATVPVTVSVTRLDSTLYSIVARTESQSSQHAVMRRIGVFVSARTSVDRPILVAPIPELWWSELF